jgi:hypothetical protein
VLACVRGKAQIWVGWVYIADSIRGRGVVDVFVVNLRGGTKGYLRRFDRGDLRDLTAGRYFGVLGTI